MATKKKNGKSNGEAQPQVDDFAADLIKQLNKEHSERIAFNLGEGNAPAVVKRWIPTGSRQLDWVMSDQADGGFPEGRIVEIQGPSSSGKSTLCYMACKNVQKMGGIVVYIDTENATSLNGLKRLGIDVEHKFVFVQTNCTEEVFSVAESAIQKARAMTKDVPVLVVWDSVANSSPKAELEGDYDQQTIGLNARAIGRGIRKIAQLIGNQNVCFLIVNQQRKNVGVMFGDDTTTPGGMAIPYGSSIRLRITSTGQKQIKDKDGNPKGVLVKAKTIKNKISTPFRSCEFEIHFGKGVYEHEQAFDLFRDHCSKLKTPGVPVDDKYVNVAGTSAWKTLTILDQKTGEVEEEVKFHKPDFGDKFLYKPEYQKYVDALYESALKLHHHDDPTEHPTFSGIDTDSAEEVKAARTKTDK